MANDAILQLHSTVVMVALASSVALAHHTSGSAATSVSRLGA